MQSCYQVCQQTCAKQQVVVNGEACKSYGTWVAGPAEAKKACELTMVSWTLLLLLLLMLLLMLLLITAAATAVACLLVTAAADAWVRAQPVHHPSCQHC
jgi:hypothetical protein